MSQWASLWQTVKKSRNPEPQFVSVFTHDTPGSDTLLHGPSYPPIRGLQISTKVVEKLLASINHTKAAGPDLMPCRFMEELSPLLAPVLMDIFQQLMDTGVLPSLWLTVYVTPIFKKCSACLPENYRPVSLTWQHPDMDRVIPTGTNTETDHRWTVLLQFRCHLRSSTALYWGHSYSSCTLMTFHQFYNHLPNAAFLQMIVWYNAISTALKIKSLYRQTLTFLNSGPSTEVCSIMLSATSLQSPGQQPLCTNLTR